MLCRRRPPPPRSVSVPLPPPRHRSCHSSAQGAAVACPIYAADLAATLQTHMPRRKMGLNHYLYRAVGFILPNGRAEQTSARTDNNFPDQSRLTYDSTPASFQNERPKLKCSWFLSNLHACAMPPVLPWRPERSTMQIRSACNERCSGAGAGAGIGLARDV